MGLCSAGLKALAETVRSGALLDCVWLNFDANGTLGDIDLSPFADALNDGGLKRLVYFSAEENAFDPKDVVILARSLMEYSPTLKYMSLPKVEEDDRKVIREIRDSLGRKGIFEIRVGNSAV